MSVGPRETFRFSRKNPAGYRMEASIRVGCEGVNLTDTDLSDAGTRRAGSHAARRAMTEHRAFELVGE